MGMSERGRELLSRYKASARTVLEDLYVKPSEYKKNEYKYLITHKVPEDCMESVRLWGNYHKFSLGYVDKKDNELHVFTPTREYIVSMSSGQIRTWYYR